MNVMVACSALSLVQVQAGSYPQLSPRSSVPTGLTSHSQI